MRDRPTWTKWKRKTGGLKVCRRCGHRHKPVVRIEGKAQRPKVCVECGAKLPGKLTYPRRGAVQWYVRQFDPATGEIKDLPADSSEHADDMIRRLQRDWSQDPVQRELIEYASILVRQIEARRSKVI